ncbi:MULTISPECIES: DUF5958 family protein [Streptomyces]|uniref:DUF5958 family protein n=1 Tax=Streptomyces TaxID=1883 RepID=UPI001C720F83
MTERSSDDSHTYRRETERIVNEIAQGLRTLDAGVGWFSGLAPSRPQAVLQEVAGYAMQAHITAADQRGLPARISGTGATARRPCVRPSRGPRRSRR